MDTIKRTTVKALIEKDGKIFIVRASDRNWELPGGKIDNDDSVEDTLRRELKEELGLDKVNIGPQINNFEFSVECYGKKYIFNVIVCECQANLSNITLSDEHAEFVWVNPKEIEKYPMQDGYKNVIQEYANEKS